MLLQSQAPDERAAPSYNTQGIQLLQGPFQLPSPGINCSEADKNIADATAVTIATEFEPMSGEITFTLERL